MPCPKICYLQARPRSISVSAQLRYENGPVQVRSISSERLPDDTSMSSETDHLSFPSRQGVPYESPLSSSHTLESPVTDNNLIWRGKRIGYGNAFPITESFQMSDQASTSSGADSCRFWTPVHQEMSRRSWLPTEIDSLGSVLTSSNTLSDALEQFCASSKMFHAPSARTSSLSTSWQCLPTSPLNTTDGASTRKVTRKIRFYPTELQSQKLRRYCGVSRLLWNRGKVAYEGLWQEVKSKLKPRADGSVQVNLSVTGVRKISEFTLRSLVVFGDRDPRQERFMQEVPRDTRDLAVKQLTNAYASFFALRKSNPKARPPGFKKKRVHTSCWNDSRALHHDETGTWLWPQTTTVAQVKSFDPLKDRTNALKKGKARAVLDPGFGYLKMSSKNRRRMDEVCSDRSRMATSFQIQRDACHRWYLVIVYEKDAKESSPVWTSQAYQDVFLDPGSVTFQTCWSPDGIAAKFGDRTMITRLLPLLRRSDDLNSKASRTAKKRDKVKLLRRSQALRTKVRRIVRDIHRKTANFLCSNFKSIFIGDWTGA